MADRANAPTAEPGNAGLDLAISWLQHSIDELATATRRTAELRADGPSSVPAIPVGSGPTPQAAPTMPSMSPAVAPNGVPTTSAETASAASTAASTVSATPLLDRIGRDLTTLAAQGQLPPIIGRDQELGWLIETLVRTTKRNPVLLGPAGAGKTAIVEGLAQLIAAGRVPRPLKDARIVEIPLSSLVAGTEYRGQLEERLAQLVKEASTPGIILFFDEIHLLEGAGRSEGGMGADEVLKPALARGAIAVIGATTPEDYRATIERDSALSRRFTPINVEELDIARTRPILRAVRDRLSDSRGVRVSDQALDVLLDFADASIINRRFPDKALDLLEQAVARAIVAGHTKVDRDDAVRTTVEWAERLSSTPTLEHFGRDLVGLARAGKLGPIVGRDREIEAIVQVLLRRTKRNPLLLGPAGTGKTAIVEGLAIRIASGQIPAALRGVRLFDVQLLPLAQAVATDSTVLRDLLLEARHPSVVLFFDEIHQLASPAIRAVGEALKPALARGEIACIGATTGEEYQANLESETALARRFSIIAVEPMDGAAVRRVLVAVRDNLALIRGVTVADDALDELVALADQFLPNRSFPDKGVDVIEQSVAYALSHDQTQVDRAAARAAVAELVGMPLDPTSSLAELGRVLRSRELLDRNAIDALLAHLGVTMRGLDSRRARPDAVVLLCGPAASSFDDLARTLARIAFGRETAVISIDLAGMTDDYAISSLLGSAPGLIGSDRPLPLHELRRAPWQVVAFRGIDVCASSIRDTIAGGLETGTLTDAIGRVIPLGSAIVVLSAPTFLPEGGVDLRTALSSRIGLALLATCDVIAGGRPGSSGRRDGAWVEAELLGPLAERFASQGVQLGFDPDFVEWLAQHLPADGTSPELYVDENVTPGLVATLGESRTALATIVDDKPVLRPSDAATGGTSAPSPRGRPEGLLAE